MTSCVGSVGSSTVLGVSAVGGRVGVGVGVDVAQLASRMARIPRKYILFIIVSMDKYT
jgi:hypothetical protein